MSLKAIILDGDQKSALATVRSLGEKKIEFSVGATRGTVMSFYSRYSFDTFVYTHPLKDKEKFVDELIAECERMGDKPLIYAFSDATALSLLRHRIRIEKVATLVMGESKDMEVAFNKRDILDLARDLDIRIPVTNCCDDLDDISELAKKMSYPAVVKPQHTAAWKENVGFTGTVKFVHRPGDLAAYAARVTTQTGEYPLVQSMIRGPEYGVELICDKGEVLTYLIHKRIRSLSPTGGASVVKETVAEDVETREMLRSAKKLMKELKWHGVAMVEFKVNQNSGKAFLMEVNARFWGSLPLAIFAGIDFPYLFYKLASKDKDILEDVEPYKVGVKSRHFLGDTAHLLAVLFKGSPMREHVYPSRSQALADYFREETIRYDVLQKNDLQPFFMEIIDIVARTLIRK